MIQCEPNVLVLEAPIPVDVAPTNKTPETDEASPLLTSAIKSRWNHEDLNVLYGLMVASVSTRTFENAVFTYNHVVHGCSRPMRE